MATIFNQGLHRTLGIQFEYKIKFQEFLSEAIASSLVVGYNTGDNTPAARQGSVDTFVGCGASMGFETKKSAYNALELICDALANNADVPASDITAINDQLLNVTKYVGMEGEEDFHFMVASFNLAEVLSRIISEVVPAPVAPIGSIVTLTLIDGGSGYEDIGASPSATAQADIVSTESTNPAGYTVGTADVTFVNGVVTNIDVIIDGGDGFGVGQIVALTLSAGEGTQETSAMAVVGSVA